MMIFYTRRLAVRTTNGGDMVAIGGASDNDIAMSYIEIQLLKAFRNMPYEARMLMLNIAESYETEHISRDVVN